MTSGGLGLHAEVTGVAETRAGISRVGAGLEPSGPNMRASIRESGDGLARALAAAAAASPTPQAALVAQTITVSQAVDLAVKLGGGQPVGSRGTPASQLVAGSEHGGLHFAAPINAGGYWIAPTVRRYAAGPAAVPVQAGVNRAIAAGGF